MSAHCVNRIRPGALKFGMCRISWTSVEVRVMLPGPLFRQPGLEGELYAARRRIEGCENSRYKDRTTHRNWTGPHAQASRKTFR